LLITILHSFALYEIYETDVYYAAIDGIITCYTFAVLGLGLWYAVRFSQMESNSVRVLIINHLASVSITLVIWLISVKYVLRVISYTSEISKEIFDNTLIWRIITGIIFYSIIVLIYYLIIYYRNFLEKTVREAELKANIKNTELDTLKSQINPHFLFNSLNSINALTLDEPEKARDMIVKLSEFLRFSVSEQVSGETTFKNELDNILKYLDIEKIRFEERLAIRTDISASCDKAVVPPLILQPIIENAVKYSLSEAVKRAEIQIIADCFHGYLKVQIENNYDKEAVKNNKGSGIGLENIRQRMKLTYGREDLMVTGYQNGIFRVNLMFPQEYML
jgi:sensor histidine kinase YesM